MDSIRARIEAALASIRNYLRIDGGDVRLHDVSSDLKVELELLGACSACSMSEMTMKIGIEQAIRKAVPEVQEVVTINAAS